MTIEQIKDKLKSKEYDFLRTDKNLGNNIIILTLGGSHAYGMDKEGSDLDVRGIALNSKSDILLGTDFEQVVDVDTDTTMYSFNKMIQLLTSSNPNTIEQLGCLPEHYLHLSEIGKKLLDKGYWVTNVKIDDKYNKSVLMIHQVIAEIKYGEYESSNSIPDHLSRDTDDNRKCNIILKSNQRNSHNRGLSKVNTSGKTGVSYNKEKNMWTAYITVNYKTKYLGDYADFNDAVNARKEAEKRYGFTCDDIVADYDKEVI